MFLRWLTPYESAEGAGAGAGGADDDQDDDDRQDRKLRGSDIRARLGQSQDAIVELSDRLADAQNRNYDLREKNRKLREERDALKSKQVAEGAVVLTKEQAAEWEAFQALGQKPDAVKQALEAKTAAEQKLAGLERDKTIREAAEGLGWKPAAVAKLPSLKEQSITFKDVTEDGKTVRRAYVGDVALAEFVQQNDPEFLPSLTAESGGAAQQQQGQGVRFPAQHSQQSGNGGGDMAARFIAEQEKRRQAQVNPLMPKQGA